jgi:glycosyltransferase involved in cell wall biosynthesis
MLVHTLDDRAVSRLLRAIVPHLQASGADLAIVCATRDPLSRLPMPPGVRIYDLHLGGRPTALGIPALARRLRGLQPDVLFAHLNGPGRAAILARALARSRTAVVTVEHAHYSTFYRRRRWLRARLTGALYPHADLIGGVSQGVIDDLLEHFPALAGRTIILPSVGPEPASITAALGVPPEHPWFRSRGQAKLICCVANVLPRKGQASLIEALPRVRAQVPGARLALVGRVDDEGYARRLQERAAELGIGDDVYFSGYREDALPYIANADVFALASTTEGASMVLVEAMACGVPVVSADCPVGPRELLGDGRYGLLVPVGDVPAMAEALTAALTDPELRAALSESGRQRAEAFSPEAVARAYLRVADALRHGRAIDADLLGYRPT